MAIENIGHTFSREAASALTGKTHYIAKLDTNGKIVLADSATSAIVGVLQNEPAAGQDAVYAFTGVAKVILGGTVPVGSHLTSDGNGKAVATTTDHQVVIGRYLGEAAGASGDLAPVQLGIFTLSA